MRPITQGTENQPQSLSSTAYTYILKGLMSGRWAKGAMIYRRKVAAELKMSVAPVLEAMVQLDREGFLETLPNRGTRVRKPTFKLLRDQVILREAIECMVARLNVSLLHKIDVSHLKVLAYEIDEAHDSDSDRTEKDMLFHRLLVEMTESELTLRTFDRVVQLGLFYGIRDLLPPVVHKASDHFNLLEELCSGDADRAEIAMRQHLRRGRDMFFKLQQ